MADSCQVDFYVLSSAGLDPKLMACRLALMSWERGLQATVVAESDSKVSELNELMWKSPDKRFLPHDHVNGSEQSPAPVQITSMDGLDQAVLNESSVVINLCPLPVPEPTRFNRLLEIVPYQDDARMASRQKFKYYRDHGITPGSHEINK